MKTSVIISTYNQPEWLKKVLVGYEQQLYKDFEVIIADDGSTEETSDVIDIFKKESELNIHHVWQKDEGFRKNKILNQAIVASTGDYLIFTDGDCIPRNDFVQKHLSLRKERRFLSGGYLKLPLTISQLITEEAIVNQNCFDKNWLLENGVKPSFKINKLTSHGTKESLLNNLTPTKATWDGMNASGFKKDIMEVNGFDERMMYGGEDRELGERLMNNGIEPIQIRYSAICVHLEHDRNYIPQSSINKNIREETKKKQKTWTDFGIKKETI